MDAVYMLVCADAVSVSPDDSGREGLSWIPLLPTPSGGHAASRGWMVRARPFER